MSNQVIVWSMFILPWATLFFMKRQDIIRFMPVALLSIVISSLSQEAGSTMGLWRIDQTLYPLNQTISYMYGLVPVVTLWLFKYTYQRFRWYLGVDAFFNLFFAYLFTPWLASRGIKAFNTSSLNLFLIVTAISLLLYLYQMWQEQEIKQPGLVYSRLQAVNKPDHRREDRY